METEQTFTRGPILSTLLKFALPVLLALLLQAMYGAVDLQVVGKFGTAADISAVSTGSQIMQTVTIVITGLAMGITVLLGQKIGEDRPEEAGAAVGSGICLFLVVAVAATVALELAAPQLQGSCTPRGMPLTARWNMCGSAPAARCSLWPTTFWAVSSGGSEIPGYR